MRHISFIVFAFATFLFFSCSGFQEASKSDKCPPAGSEILFAKLMNPGFADDYVGCDVVTTAQFFASGAGENVLKMSLEDKVVFRCLPPGATGEKNPLSGETDANFVVVPKASSNLVFELKPGDLVKLRGGNNVHSITIGGSYKQVVFVSISIDRTK
jgi:hypothetical protein